ncbi:hypothetical protein [Celeribacter indicus]|uniref:Uncharacterized protein n=1 Tax=Celeribacter indicus TaxID=1208324 RepID=A0A0B5E1B3_9RHOB|nr:hypothetical protein [Celeribacter indicus]AJE47175.1 hypothetical protein P73_2460 [Celeribacter indicus]SDW00114.1 hypothetical protein SAMN05443573_10110 [Celeribacter indicus]
MNFTDLDDVLALKPKGVFRVENVRGRTIITVNRPGELEEIILCLSPGHANQVRMALSDQGLTGLVAEAL